MVSLAGWDSSLPRNPKGELGLRSSPFCEFSDKITQDKVIGIADAIKSLKLDQFGYLYLTVDDLWNLPDRDQETHQMQVNQERFPQGISISIPNIHMISFFR